MMKADIVLYVRYLALVPFIMMGLFGCATPKVEGIEPVLVETEIGSSDISLRDAEEIEEVPLITGIEEALKEGKPVETDIATVLRIRRSKTGKEGKDKGRLISIRCQNADLLDVLDVFAEISGLNLVVHPGVSGTVTVRFENVPWDQALDIILKMNNLRFAIEGNVLRISQASVFQQEIVRRIEQQRQQIGARRVQAQLAPLKTKLISVNFADPSTIGVIVQQVLEGTSSSLR